MFAFLTYCTVNQTKLLESEKKMFVLSY